MHCTFRRIGMMGLICACFSVGAQEANYVGLMYKYRHMPGRSTASYSTQSVVPKLYNGAEIFFERRFDTDVGVHIGYEQSQSKIIRHTFTANQLFIGAPQAAGDTSKTSTRVRGLQFDMVGYMNETPNIDLVGLFGVSLLQVDMDATITSAGVVHNMSPGKSLRPIPTFGIGMHYFFKRNKFALRLAGNWEGTSLYRMHLTDDDGVRRKIKPFKPSWCVTIGLVANMLG